MYDGPVDPEYPRADYQVIERRGQQRNFHIGYHLIGKTGKEVNQQWDRIKTVNPDSHLILRRGHLHPEHIDERVWDKPKAEKKSKKQDPSEEGNTEDGTS